MHQSTSEECDRKCQDKREEGDASRDEFFFIGNRHLRFDPENNESKFSCHLAVSWCDTHTSASNRLLEPIKKNHTTQIVPLTFGRAGPHSLEI